MRVRLVFSVCLLLVLVLSHHPAYSQGSKFSIRVELAVTAEDSIKSEVTSYLNRELRALGDVVITDNDPILRIRVIALRNYQGYILSAVATNPLIASVREMIISGNSERSRAAGLVYLANEERIVNNFVRTGLELPLLCKQTIATVDSDNIEPDRREWQKVQEILRRDRDKKRP